MDRFKIEVANTDLYNKLNQDLNTDPNYNYDILSAELQAAKNLHILRKIRKFNRRKINNMSNRNLHQSRMIIMSRLSKTLKCMKRIR